MAANVGRSREDGDLSAPEDVAVDHSDATLETAVAAAEVLINWRRLNDREFMVTLCSQKHPASILTRKVVAGKHGHSIVYRAEPEHAGPLERFLLVLLACRSCAFR
jgi:hypothetical protein